MLQAKFGVTSTCSGLGSFYASWLTKLTAFKMGSINAYFAKVLEVVYTVYTNQTYEIIFSS